MPNVREWDGPAVLPHYVGVCWTGGGRRAQTKGWSEKIQGLKIPLDLYAHETERDPHEEIAHLEERIDELDTKIESCRKFILASRIAITGARLGLPRRSSAPSASIPA